MAAALSLMISCVTWMRLFNARSHYSVHVIHAKSDIACKLHTRHFRHLRAAARNGFHEGCDTHTHVTYPMNMLYPTQLNGWAFVFRNVSATFHYGLHTKAVWVAFGIGKAVLEIQCKHLPFFASSSWSLMWSATEHLSERSQFDSDCSSALSMEFFWRLNLWHTSNAWPIVRTIRIACD